VNKQPQTYLISEKDKTQYFQLGTVPKVFYCPEWLTLAEEAQLITLIDSDPKNWQNLTRRRLKMYGGIPVSHSDGMIEESLPEWLQYLFDKLRSIHLVAARNIQFNHVLLNEYQNGMGIASHSDGPLYENFVIILSLAGNAVIDFYQKDNLSSKFSLFLASRSLLIFSDEVYEYYHQISDREYDIIDQSVINCSESGLTEGCEMNRGERRLSLTIRQVKFVSTKEPQAYGVQTAEQKEEMLRREQVFYSSISEK